MAFEFARAAREARKVLRMSRAEVEALQQQKFRKLVCYAGEHSPYYAELMRERQLDPKTCTPGDFPVLTKQDVIDNFDRLVTDRKLTLAVVREFLQQSKSPADLLWNKYRVLHTSGSSGQVGYFVYSLQDWVGGLIHPVPPSQAARRTRRGFRRLRLAFYAAIDGHYAGVSVVSTFGKGLSRLFLKLRLFDVNSPVREVVNALNAWQPQVLAGYTTAAKVLADEQLAGRLQIHPAQVVTSGETMSEADREYLQRAFGCRASNGYGATEHLSMGSPEPDGKSMVLYDESMIYEFYPDHSVVTNLFNYTLPLIRYRMADVLEPLPADQQHGPFLRIKPVIGRQETVPYFINDRGERDFISPFAIIELFIPGVSRFQMQVTGERSFDFLICPEPGLDDAGRQQAQAATRARLQEILARKEMTGIQADIRLVDELAVNPRTGKFQLIVPGTG